MFSGSAYTCVFDIMWSCTCSQWQGQYTLCLEASCRIQLFWTFLGCPRLRVNKARQRHSSPPFHPHHWFPHLLAQAAILGLVLLQQGRPHPRPLVHPLEGIEGGNSNGQAGKSTWLGCCCSFSLLVERNHKVFNHWCQQPTAHRLCLFLTVHKSWNHSPLHSLINLDLIKRTCVTLCCVSAAQSEDSSEHSPPSQLLTAVSPHHYFSCLTMFYSEGYLWRLTHVVFIGSHHMALCSCFATFAHCQQCWTIW